VVKAIGRCIVYVSFSHFHAGIGFLMSWFGLLIPSFMINAVISAEKMGKESRLLAC
jgi:energy-converting hydrogenase Eha subunit E